MKTWRLIMYNIFTQLSQSLKQSFISFNIMDDSENLYGNQQPTTEAERYQKIKVLGEGSMGKAYLVQSSEDGKPYVMKRINIGHLQPKQKQNALRQSQLHSLLTHPNIVQFKQVYQTTGDKICIIMEYAQGGDLEEFIKSQSNKLLPQQTILNMFVQICLGLQEVHSKKIIHRDLKTANIFLTKDRQIKIGDFGISRALDKTQMAATSMIGTPYYLSPQMVQGKPYSTKADVWALGVILYQLCSFKLPFQANSLPVLALKILKGSFPPIHNQYSKDIKSLLLQMLCTDQKKRPSVQSILTKPFLSKYVPQQQKAKIILKQQQRLQEKKEKEKQKLKKVEKIEKAEKVDDKDLKQKARRQKEEKREQLRKQMRQDLKKKRGEKQYQSQKPVNASLNVPNQAKQLKKSPRKDISITPKLEQVKVKKQELVKPWKTKKVGQKKDITVQIFAPPQPKVPFKIPQEKNPSSKEIDGRKSMPLIAEKVNYHYVQNNKQQEEQYSQQFEEEQVEEDEQFQQILNQVKNIEELTKKFPNTSKQVLFEDSANFDSTSSLSPPKQQHRPEQLQSLKLILNTQSLEQLRFILEQSLGENRFRQAYSVVKQHLDNYYELLKDHEQDRERLKKQYMFNRGILRDKLNFLTREQFEKSLELLFTLIIYQQIQTHNNTEGLMEMRASKYDRLL